MQTYLMAETWFFPYKTWNAKLGLFCTLGLTRRSFWIKRNPFGKNTSKIDVVTFYSFVLPLPIYAEHSVRFLFVYLDIFSFIDKELCSGRELKESYCLRLKRYRSNYGSHFFHNYIYTFVVNYLVINFCFVFLSNSPIHFAVSVNQFEFGNVRLHSSFSEIPSMLIAEHWEYQESRRWRQSLWGSTDVQVL